MRSRLLSLNNLLLCGILVLALWLRLWGVGGLGLPRIGYVDDEPALADNALELLRQDQLDFSQWRIGSTQVYLQAAIGKLIFAIKGLAPSDVPTYKEIITTKQISASVIGVPYPVPEYYLWGRIIIGIMGGLSVIILYFIGKIIRSRTVGLISAFFLAVISLHVEYSHYLMRTIPGTFFLLIALIFILLAYQKQKLSFYLLSFIAVYVAIYTKQNNLILLAPLSLTLTINIWSQAQQRSLREIIYYTGFGGGLTLAILTVGWIFFHFNIIAFGQNIFYRIFQNPYLYGGYHFGFSGENTAWWIIKQLFIAPIASWRLIAVLAIPGTLIAFQLKGKGWILLAVLIPYLLIISQFTVRFLHWLMPIVPILALLAALSLDWIYWRMRQNVKINRQILSALYLFIIILIPMPSIRTVITLNHYASQPDVRNVASEWMKTELPPGSRIIIDSWGPYLESATHQVKYVQYIGDQDLQSYRDINADYLVLNSINFSRIVSAKSDPRAKELIELRTHRLKRIMREMPLEHKFVGPALFNPPVINVLIYRLD